MPNSKVHSKLTANAVRLANYPVPVENLVRQYCNYPDLYFSDPVKLAAYFFATDGVQFHYPPDTPYNDLYRYWNFCGGKLRRVREFKNDNYIHMTNGFRHYLARCIAIEEPEEMLKFAGCLLHTLQDSLFSLHALEGAGGADLMFLDRLGFFARPPTEQLAEISISEIPAVTDYTPRQLGNSVEETVMNLYTEYARRNQDSRRCCFQFLMARHEQRTEPEILLPVQRMYHNAVTLCADVLKTIFALRNGNFTEPHDRLLTEIEPFAFPLGGGGSMAFRFRSYGVDTSYDQNGDPAPLAMSVGGNTTRFQHGFSFGIHYENALLFHLPEDIFGSFYATIGLSPDTVTKNPITVEIINNDSVVNVFELEQDSKPSQAVVIPHPQGIFGIREFSQQASGILITAQPLLKKAFGL